MTYHPKSFAIYVAFERTKHALIRQFHEDISEAFESGSKALIQAAAESWCKDKGMTGFRQREFLGTITVDGERLDYINVDWDDSRWWNADGSEADVDDMNKIHTHHENSKLPASTGKSEIK